MTNAAQPNLSETREYWNYNVGEPTGPVAQFRMSQLVDYDLRLTDPARTVYRFLIGWYMHTRGDALASVRHIVKTMRGRAPDGARHLSRSAVQRAITLLVETGWLVRTYVGKGRSGSRYVPVLNVLDLASQGTLPIRRIPSVPPHRDTSQESVASHSTGTVVSHFTGTQTSSSVPPAGTKTLLLDPSTDSGTGNSTAAVAPLGLTAASPCAGFDDVWIAYGRYGNKTAAREAFAAIANPNVEHIAERAASWASSAKPGQRRMPLEKWLQREKYDEADRRVEAALPRLRKGAVRRDAEIEELIWDGPACDLVLNWFDAQPGEPKRHVMRVRQGHLDSILGDLACAVEDLEFKRVLIDFHTAKDGRETEQWHRYPDAANDNLPREGDSDDTSRSLPWADAA